MTNSRSGRSPLAAPSLERVPAPPAFLSDEEQRRFERLLERTMGLGFKLVVIETPTPRDRRELLDWLAPKFAACGATVKPVDLVQLLGQKIDHSPQSVNVWSALQQAVPPESVADHRAALVLWGVEELMYHGAAGRSDLLQQFNVQRDLFVRDYPCWWLLLIHPASRQQWKTVAPDFCDFVALWVEAPAPAVDGGAERSPISRLDQDRFGTDVFGVDDWPPELRSANMAIRASRLDAALDHITSFRAAASSAGQTERGVAIANLLEGDVRFTRGDTGAALRLWHDHALPTFERLNHSREQALTVNRIADVMVAQGNLPEAQRLCGESLRIAQRLAESDPANAAWQRDLSVSFERLGNLATAQGNLPEAQRLFGESLRIPQRLSESDPANAAWQRDLSVSFIKLGDLATAQGNLPEAQWLFGESLRIAQRLSESDPANAEWQRDLSVSYVKVADVLEQLDSPEAMAYWRKAHDTLAGLVSAGLFVSPQDQQVLELLRAKINP